MKRLIRGSQIDITLFPIQSEELMDSVIKRVNKRFDEEKNDPILGYIRNGKFYTLNLEHTEVPSSTEDKTPPTEVSGLPPRTLTVLPRVQNLSCFANEGSSISYPAVADHYSLKCISGYKDTCWIVLNKHPGELYNPMSYITGWNTLTVEEYDIWTDERSNSYIAVVTGMDCD